MLKIENITVISVRLIFIMLLLSASISSSAAPVSLDHQQQTLSETTPEGYLPGNPPEFPTDSTNNTDNDADIRTTDWLLVYIVRIDPHNRGLPILRLFRDVEDSLPHGYYSDVFYPPDGDNYLRSV